MQYPTGTGAGTMVTVESQKEWISILGNFGVAILLRELYNGLLLQGTRRVGLLLLQRGMGIPTHARLRGRLHVLLLQGQGVLRHRPCTAAVVLLRPNVWVQCHPVQDRG